LIEINRGYHDNIDSDILESTPQTPHLTLSKRRRAAPQNGGQNSKVPDRDPTGMDKMASRRALPAWLTNLLKKMMYVSGETAEPSTETTGMVEEIVRQQVIEMVNLNPPCQGWPH
jgi:hypothetical protein